MLNRGPILAGGAVTALCLWATDHPALAVLAVCAGILATQLSRPFRDPMRLFSDEDRRTILQRAGGVCEWPGCGVVLHYEGDCSWGECDDCYQADHVFAWSKGGHTSLGNGQALCRKHNRIKSDR